MVANDVDEYRPFWDPIGRGLRYPLEATGYETSAEVRDRVLRGL